MTESIVYNVDNTENHIPPPQNQERQALTGENMTESNNSGLTPEPKTEPLTQPENLKSYF